MAIPQKPVFPDETTRRRYELTMRHTLAMEALPLVLTLLLANKDALERLLDAERELEADLLLDSSGPGRILHDRSFRLQIRIAKLLLGFIDQIVPLQQEIIQFAAKEKTNA